MLRSWKIGPQKLDHEMISDKRKARFLEYLLTGDNISLSKAAKKFSYSYSKAWQIYYAHFNPKTKSRVPIAAALTTVDAKTFFAKQYFKNNYVAMNWNDLTSALKNTHPILKEYKNKTIENELRKRTNLRAISIKRKPANSDSRSLLQRQLLVGSDILHLLDQKELVCFFDETVISEKNFKKTAIGNSTLMPIVPNYSISKIHILTMFSLHGKVAIQLSSKPNTSATIVEFFKQVIPRFLNRQSMKKVVVVLDNAAVQKTAEFKGLVQQMPMNLLYNIPCSPFLNMVEDFFLKIKSGFKNHYYQNKENCLQSCLQAIKNHLRTDKCEWYFRKFVKQIKLRLEVHSSGGGDLSNLVSLLKRPTPDYLGKRTPTHKEGIADQNDDISKPMKKLLHSGGWVNFPLAQE